MKRVWIHSLTLEGFGVYADTTTFRLQHGANVLVAPNEEGKSTLLHGVLAALFGLPERSDESVWGTARFRSWKPSSAFRADILLATSEAWHRIEHDFENHTVRWCTAPAAGAAGTHPKDAGEGAHPEAPPAGKWKESLEGEFRPGSRGRSKAALLGQRYEKRLKDLLGISDADLFKLVFCMMQEGEQGEREREMRTSRVPSTVADFISGAGTGIDDVLGIVFERFGRITFATGDFGLIRPGRKKPANLRTDGELDRARAELIELERKASALRGSIEALHEARSRIATLEEERTALKERLQKVSAQRRAFASWTSARRMRDERLKAAASLERAIDEFEREQHKAEEAAAEIERRFPEYSAEGFPFDEILDLLTSMKEIAEGIERRTSEMQSTRERIDSMKEEAEALAKTLEEEFSHFASNPHLIRDFESLKKAVSDLEAKRSEIDALRSEAQELKELIAAEKAWEQVPPDEIERLRQDAPAFIEKAERLRSLSLELQDLERSVEERFGDLMRDQSLLEDATAYEDRLKRLSLEAQHAAWELDQARKAEADLRDLRSRIETVEAELHTELGVPVEDLAARLSTPTAPAGPDGSGTEPPAAASVAASTAIEDSDTLPPARSVLRRFLERKIRHLDEEASLLARIADLRSATSLLRSVALPSLLAAAAGGAAGWLLAHAGGATAAAGFLAALLGALLLGGATGFLAYRRQVSSALGERRKAEAAYKALRRSAEDLERRLGDLAHRPRERLSALIEMIDSLDRMEEEAAAKEQALPSDEETSRLEQASAEAERTLEAFKKRMEALGPDPGEAAREYEQALKQKQSLKREMDEISREVGPPDWPDRAAVSLPGLWPSLARLFLAAQGIPGTEEVQQRASEVAQWVLSAGEADWNSWLERSKRVTEGRHRLSEIETILGSSGSLSPGEPLPEQARALEEQIEDLRARCSPFGPETPIEQVRAELERYEEASSRLQSLESRMDEARGRLDELASQIPEASSQWQELLDTLKQRSPEAATALIEAASQAQGAEEGQAPGTVGEPEQAPSAQGQEAAPGLQSAAPGPAPSSAHAELSERIGEARALRLKVRASQEVRSKILASHGAGSIDDLRLRREESRLEASRASDEIENLEKEMPLFAELAEATPEQVQERFEKLEKETASIEERLERIDSERHELISRHAASEADLGGEDNIAQIEERISALRSRIQALELERDALALAYKSLSEAAETFASAHRQRLAERISELFASITLREDRSILLDERFNIVIDESGRKHSPQQLSQGARDQLAMAVRLAVAELVAENIQVPMLLDDPFLNFDEERLASMETALKVASRTRQIILVSHRPDFERWGEPIEVARA